MYGEPETMMGKRKQRFRRHEGGESAETPKRRNGNAIGDFAVAAFGFVLTDFCWRGGPKPRSRNANGVFEGTEAQRHAGTKGRKNFCKSLCLCIGTTPQADHPPFTQGQHAGRAEIEWRMRTGEERIKELVKSA